ARFNDLRFV
nr:Chain I, ALA-ARG-PHE-ASN-ASP-LEU-ARG-PHE-VAL [synthetic construct]5W69_J Chain J, ALA-ARG-PHE-ASN-ASP-LEU-ARG-PHE-VAL [synthetic construct]5W69_K Chain K, ALA-ARG-PHE-ASN-ASP-LEU-ARG-PHE-VAL [synthetic construct]5W69_L Chain L, ALA-ARG-PHE-ASN-ASP-LEU-ARG-PHE-VAL [synthetic construct]